MAFWTNLVNAVKEGDLQGVVSQTQQGLGNLANTVKQAADQATEDCDNEAERIRSKKERANKVTNLPWEFDDESKSIIQDDLMERILALSVDKSTFTDPPSPITVFDFELENHVEVITRLLELDPNLASRNATLSPKMNEVDFWRNYFHRCALLRVEMGVDKPLSSTSSVGGGEGHRLPDHETEAEALDQEVIAELEEDDNFSLEDIAGELDDLEDGELDEELEAQIAAELEEEEAAVMVESTVSSSD